MKSDKDALGVLDSDAYFVWCLPSSLMNFLNLRAHTHRTRLGFSRISPRLPFAVSGSQEPNDARAG
jgi:hypothetical protein